MKKKTFDFNFEYPKEYNEINQDKKSKLQKITFIPTKEVKIVGSFILRSTNTSNYNVDVHVNIPSVILNY
jgi:phosphopantetheine adenylyltransferase